MFLFKKIVGPFFFPLSLCLEILIIGLILLWFIPKRKAGRIILTLGVTLLALLSYGVFTDMLLRPLEYRYAPLLDLRDLAEVRWIAVLGGGHTSDPQLPSNSQLSGSALSRLVEGIRVHKSLPGSKLILSGGALYDPVPDALVSADVALILGVDRRNLILETSPKDTEDEARLIKNIVGNDPFVLVTSASHMARSMALFRKMGTQPIPAPTDYGLKGKQGGEVNPAMFFPWVGELANVEMAVYEYLGLAWAKLRGRI